VIREEQIDPEAGRPRGLLRPAAPPEGRFRHERRLPPEDLAPWVMHFWMVAWDLRGLAPYRPETLPHPNVHVVFGPEGSKVNGVLTNKFTTVLQDRSHVFGVKFQPGGFRPILGKPVASIANRTIAASRIVGAAIVKKMEALSGDEQPLIDTACAWLREVLPAQPDPAATEAAELVAKILQDREIVTVDALVSATGTAKRSLQRLFREYVGVPPKWVIRRYRLHELVERLHAGERWKGAETAAQLGYFDQAHLINDFRSITGCTPEQYRQRLQS
jgi:AraC-like DNA-binding protein